MRSCRLDGRSVSARDASGNLTSIVSPTGRQATFTHDAAGRLTSFTDALGQTVTFGFDSMGNVTSMTTTAASQNRTVQFGRDAAGQLVAVTDPMGRTHEFLRDASGAVTEVVLPGPRSVLRMLDAAGYTAAIQPPDRPAHLFDYTPTGNLARYTPPLVGGENEAVEYSYDGAGRLTSALLADGALVTLAYDANGRLVTMSEPLGSHQYSYDAVSGFPSSVSSPGNVTIGYGYLAGAFTSLAWSGAVSGSVSRTLGADYRTASLSIDGNLLATFTYDADGMLTQAGDLTITRNAQSGLPTQLTIGCLTETLTYNGFGELATYSVSCSGNPVYGLTLTRDDLGRITQKTETAAGQTHTTVYAYDTQGRLAQVKVDAGVPTTYTYDGNDNRLTVVRGGAPSSASYDAQDRLISYGSAAYAYHPTGTLASIVSGGQTTTFGYDARGQLISASLPGGTQVEYVRDVDGRCIGRLEGGVLAIGYLYEPGRGSLVAQVDTARSIMTSFVPAEGRAAPAYMQRDGLIYRLITDVQGSVRLVVNVADGTVAQQLVYDEFGVVLLDTNPGFQPFGYAGGFYDADTGLVQFGSRPYDATTGRFASRSPAFFAGEVNNLYNYAGQDPVNNKAPLGAGYAPISYGSAGVSGGGSRWVAKPRHRPTGQGQQLASYEYLEDFLPGQTDWGNLPRDSAGDPGFFTGGLPDVDGLPLGAPAAGPMSLPAPGPMAIAPLPGGVAPGPSGQRPCSGSHREQPFMGSPFDVCGNIAGYLGRTCLSAFDPAFCAADFNTSRKCRNDLACVPRPCGLPGVGCILKTLFTAVKGFVH